MWAFSLFSKSHIGNVNHGKSENVCGVGVSSTFLAVMRCSYQFFAVLRYSEPPNAPLNDDFPLEAVTTCSEKNSRRSGPSPTSLVSPGREKHRRLTGC